MPENINLNNIKNISGLSEKEVATRLLTEGYNEIPSAKKRGIIAIALSVIREPMLLLLIAGGIIYMFLGDMQDALIGFQSVHARYHDHVQQHEVYCVFLQIFHCFLPACHSLSNIT